MAIVIAVLPTLPDGEMSLAIVLNIRAPFVVTVMEKSVVRLDSGARRPGKAELGAPLALGTVVCKRGGLEDSLLSARARSLRVCIDVFPSS